MTEANRKHQVLLKQTSDMNKKTLEELSHRNDKEYKLRD